MIDVRMDHADAGDHTAACYWQLVCSSAALRVQEGTETTMGGFLNLLAFPEADRNLLKNRTNEDEN